MKNKLLIGISVLILIVLSSMISALEKQEVEGAWESINSVDLTIEDDYGEINLDYPCDISQAPEECGKCEGKVTELTLRYDGAETAAIKVVQKNGEIIFQNTVASGESFSFIGTDKGTLGTEIKIYINEAENTRIHTSCSKPIYPGMVGGDFTIIKGKSKQGGLLCQFEGENGCGECDGKITELTLQYIGTTPAMIKIMQKNGDIIFQNTVAPGNEFSFNGTDKGTMGTEITIYTNNNEN